MVLQSERNLLNDSCHSEPQKLIVEIKYKNCDLLLAYNTILVYTMNTLDRI